MFQQPAFTKTRLVATGIITALILSLLLWEHFHGGVASHHILQRGDLPQFSNWLGAILLPALTWFLLGSIHRRISKQIPENESNSSETRIFVLFGIGLLFGVAIAISFANQFEFFLENVFYIFFILSLIFPIFYAEFILGFIFGMTYTFGAVIPTAFVLILAGIGFLLFTFIRPLLLKLIRRIQA